MFLREPVLDCFRSTRREGKYDGRPHTSQNLKQLAAPLTVQSGFNQRVYLHSGMPGHWGTSRFDCCVYNRSHILFTVTLIRCFHSYEKPRQQLGHWATYALRAFKQHLVFFLQIHDRDTVIHINGLNEQLSKVLCACNHTSCLLRVSWIVALSEKILLFLPSNLAFMLLFVYVYISSINILRF